MDAADAIPHQNERIEHRDVLFDMNKDARTIRHEV